jgi:hypothetical protein
LKRRSPRGGLVSVGPQILLASFRLQSDQSWCKERNHMAHTNEQTYNGFAIPIKPDTDLGMAMLIAEDEDGKAAVGISGSRGTRLNWGPRSSWGV